MLKKKKNRIIEDEIVITEETIITEDVNVEEIKENKNEDEVVIAENNTEEPEVVIDKEPKQSPIIDEIVVEDKPLIPDELDIHQVIKEPDVVVDEEPVVAEEVPEEVIISDEVVTSDEEPVVSVELIPEESQENVEEQANIESEEDKRELNEYFDDSRKVNAKQSKKKPKKQKVTKESRRALKQRKAYDDIKNQRVFRFRKKKYYKVEEFIKFLNDNYLDIDKIAQEVLDDKAFYGFVSKKSGVFESSIKEFKKIKEEIDN